MRWPQSASVLTASYPSVGDDRSSGVSVRIATFARPGGFLALSSHAWLLSIPVQIRYLSSDGAVVAYSIFSRFCMPPLPPFPPLPAPCQHILEKVYVIRPWITRYSNRVQGALSSHTSKQTIKPSSCAPRPVLVFNRATKHPKPHHVPLNRESSPSHQPSGIRVSTLI